MNSCVTDFPTVEFPTGEFERSEADAKDASRNASGDLVEKTSNPPDAGRQAGVVEREALEIAETLVSLRFFSAISRRLPEDSTSRGRNPSTREDLAPMASSPLTGEPISMSLLHIRTNNLSSRRVAATVLTLLLAVTLLLSGCSDTKSASDSGDGKSDEGKSGSVTAGNVKSGSGGSNPALDKLVNSLRTKIDPNAKLPTKPAPVKPKTDEPNPPAPLKVAPTKPAGQPSDEVLTADFEKTITALVAALSSGSLDAAMATVLADDHFKTVLTPGALTVLGSQLPTQNRRVLQTVIDVAGGKKIEHTYTAGRLNSSGTKGAAFRLGMPMISGVEVRLDIEDVLVPIVIKIEQSIWFEGSWKIFNMKIF
jgi:uncharacterized protein YceK